VSREKQCKRERKKERERQQMRNTIEPEKRESEIGSEKQERK